MDNNKRNFKRNERRNRNNENNHNQEINNVEFANENELLTKIPSKKMTIATTNDAIIVNR